LRAKSPAANTYSLGDATLIWSNVYSTNGVTTTSDARKKKDITESDLGLDFINSLRPVSYYWKSGPDGDLHYGLIAQETEKAVNEAKAKAGNKTKAGEQVIISHDPKSDAYGLKYNELISPLIKALQEFYADFETLTGKVSRHDRDIASLKVENTELKARVDKAERENAAIKAYLCGKDSSAIFCR
jgi:hypothetical protein